MKTRITYAVALSLIAIISFSTRADAAAITWGSATAVGTAAGNSSDVSTNGTLIEAFNAVNDSQTPLASFNTTVNGVPFTATNDLLPGNNTSTSDFSSGTNGGDATYDALLSTLDFGGGANLVSLTLGDGDGDTTATGAGLLTVGNQYEIQVWFVDDRTVQDSRVMQFGDGNSNTVDLNDQFSIGTFTADATTLQILTLNAQGFGNSHINAYQIREIPTPEPSTFILATLGLLSLGITRRRRRR